MLEMRAHLNNVVFKEDPLQPNVFSCINLLPKMEVSVTVNNDVPKIKKKASDRILERN
jgi:hypothetical protein